MTREIEPREQDKPIEKPRTLTQARTGGSLMRLTIGELPRTMRRQTQNARKYRRQLETLVMETKGEVHATDAHLIDEATQAEVHASVCRWLLRTRLEAMTVSDISRCSEQILKAKTTRNKAVERLGLNAPPPNPWEVLEADQSEESNND
jgi:hypothetical protein